MSLAYSAPLAQPGTRTWRQFQQAITVTVLAVLVGCVIYAIEKYAFQPPRRFLENPTDVMMRALGVSHFMMAWLFLFTSRKLYTPANLLRLATWTAIGAAGCIVYGMLGGSRQPAVMFGFYALFLIHEIRDEAGLARAHGDLSVTGPLQERWLGALVGFTTTLFIAIIAGVFLLRGWLLSRHTLDGLPELVIPSVAVIVALTTFGLAWRCWHLARQSYGSLLGALQAVAPLLHVYRALFLVLLVGSLLGSVGFNLVILIHVSVWLVFGVARLSGRENAQAQGVWGWVRTTPAGFLTLHLVLAVGVLILLALRVHVWQRAGWFCECLSSSSFPYWSVLHICMSFGRK